VFVNFVAIVRV